jgi:hypothetical protein
MRTSELENMNGMRGNSRCVFSVGRSMIVKATIKSRTA